MSVREKCATHMSYFEGAGSTGYELQQSKLKATAKRKVEMEASKASGDGTSTQGIGNLAQGVRASRSKIVCSAPQAQQGLRGLSEIAKERRKR